MLKEEEIRDILNKVIPELKKIDNSERQKKVSNPSFYPSYCKAVDYMERISVHAEIGKFPDKLFAKRSPNQEEKEWTYVKENYKQITLPIFIDYLSTVTRPFHNANWNIDYAPDEKKYNDFPFQKYVDKEIKNYGSIENFVKFIVSQRKAVDANGVIAIRPDNLFTKQDSLGNLIIDPDKLTEPVPVYYSSEKIVAWSEGEYAMLMMDHRCSCSYYGNTEMKGYKFEFYDNQNIWVIEQFGKFIDYTFKISLFFNHEWNRLPVIKLMGIPQVCDEGIIWQSPFLYITDILDLIALNHSNLQVSINMSVYPYRVMIGDVCEWKDSDGNPCCDGTITNKDNRSYNCSSCNGTGLKSRISPMGTMLLKPKTRLEDGDSTFTQKPLEYISPSVTTLEFLENKIAKDEMKARSILHLQTSNSIIKGSENMTATGMTLDMKALYAFVKTVSDQTFYIWEFIVDAVGFMRYGVDFKKPKFTYPTTFDFVTESDIIAQLKAAVDGGLPPFVIYSIIYRYLQTLYFNDQTTASIFNLIVRSDRLLTLSNEAIALKMARGTVHDWEEILHTSAINFVNELIDENPKFLEQDFAKQKEQLIQKAKAVPCNAGECSIGSEPNGQQGIDNMVAGLNTTANV